VPVQQHSRPSVEPKNYQIPPDLAVFDDEYCDIAILSQAYPYYCGGRAYDFSIHLMLRELGYNTVFYTDTQPTYNAADYLSYPKPYVKHVNVRHVTLPNASIFCGSPLLGAMRATELAAHYHRPLHMIVYDCPEWLVNNKYIGAYHARFEVLSYTELRYHLQTTLDDIPDVKIYVLTENSIDAWARWFEIDESHFHALNPRINNRVADILRDDIPKNDWIISISRNDYRKAWEETIEVFNEHADTYELHIITNYLDGFQGFLNKHLVPAHRVHFHQNISDLHKFELIKRSKLLLSTSHFEGFGMWAAEGLKCGTPVVCYDLESLRDIHHPQLHKATIHDTDDLKSKLRHVLSQPSVCFDPVDDFDYENGLIKISSIMDHRTKDIAEFDVVEEDSVAFNTIRTTWGTRPVVYHFNSMYKTYIAKQKADSHICWRNILSHIVHNKPNTYFNDINDQLTVFTFSTFPRQTLLESVCEHLGIKLQVFRPDVKTGKWQHNDRIQFTLDALAKINTPYVLHVDAEDAVICGDLRKLFDVECDVLYAAEEMCHPVSQQIEEQQRALINNTKTPFHYLNAGVVFGKLACVKDVFAEASTLTKYETPNAGDSNSDQGKHNQVYISRYPDVQIDYLCKYFYCNDHQTDASKYLEFVNA
jgi:glycosyltransferase involved in cell wall biosynthesis